MRIPVRNAFFCCAKAFLLMLIRNDLLCGCNGLYPKFVKKYANARGAAAKAAKAYIAKCKINALPHPSILLK